MSIRGLAPVLLVFLFSVSSFAKKEAVFFGGGGEPATPGTIFDDTYKSFGLFSEGSGWTSRSYFNGGHPQSEALAQKISKGKNKPMTAENMKAEIAQLKARIQSGDLKKGDQLMVTLSTHGLQPKSPQSTHNVETIDGNFNLDELKELRDLAEAKGVNLAFMDLSCFSGATLDLGSDKTCVISAASHNVGYTNAGESLGKEMQKGANLEDAFLKGRITNSPGTPQISTEAGRKAYEATQFLSESMRERTSIGAAMGNSPLDCYGTSSNPFKKLVNQLRDIEKSQSYYKQARVKLGVDEGVDPLIKKLEDAVTKYEQSRQDAKKTFDTIGSVDKKTCKNVLDYQLCGTLRQWEFGLNKLKQQQQTGSLDQKGKAELAAYTQLVGSSEFQSWKAMQADFVKKSSEMYYDASQVAIAERGVYEKLYEHFSKDAKKPNPCRNFVL